MVRNRDQPDEYGGRELLCDGRVLGVRDQAVRTEHESGEVGIHRRRRERDRVQSVEAVGIQTGRRRERSRAEAGIDRATEGRRERKRRGEVDR